jgi:hypothetical protein
LSLVLIPIPELQHAFLPLEVLRVRELAPNSFFFYYFTFGFAVVFVKEFGGALDMIFVIRGSLGNLCVHIP